MKTSQFKQLIKEACKEAFKEDLHDIILEVVKSSGQQQLVEQKFKAPIQKQQFKLNDNDFKVDKEEIRNRFKSMIEENTQPSYSNNEHPTTLQLRGSSDTVSEGSALPQGEVGLDLIANLMKGTT